MNERRDENASHRIVGYHYHFVDKKDPSERDENVSENIVDYLYLFVAQKLLVKVQVHCLIIVALLGYNDVP